MDKLNIPKIYSDPVISRKRLGNALQPYVNIKESLSVDKHYVLLSEIPNDYDKVKVSRGDRHFHETDKNKFLKEDTYWVDYVNGVVYFHESLHGRTLDFEYTGEGVWLFPDSRVYHTGDGAYPTVKDKFVDVDRQILVQKNRVDTLIRDNPQPSEVVDMRIDRNGKIFPVAKDRIDSEQKKIEDAYFDAKGKKHNSLKERIDSLELATDDKFEDNDVVISDIWASIDLVPGQITLEVGKLEEKMNGEINKLTSSINMLPEEISLKVEELRQEVDGKISSSNSQIKMLSDRIDLKVDVDGVISSINLSKEGIRLQGKKIQIDGETKIAKAVIKSAHIDSIDASKIRTGIIKSENNNTSWNLNNGDLLMKRADIELGGGAMIKFTDSGNKIRYTQIDPQTQNVHHAGLGVGKNINERFPFVYIGSSRGSNLNVRDEQAFTGFIANTDARVKADNIGNSVVGAVFHIRDKAVSFRQGFRFDLQGKVKTMSPLNTHLQDYDIGLYNRRFRNVYTYNIRNNGEVRLRDSRDGRTGGWLFQTTYSGDGSAITLRGLNGGKYNYSIGARNANYNRITSIFLKNKPNVSSDKRLKEDFKQLELGLDFILDLKPTSFRFKSNSGKKNKLDYGFLAQEVQLSLEKQGVDVGEHSILSKDGDGYLALEHEQFIAPMINSIKELNKEIEELKKEIKELKKEVN